MWAAGVAGSPLGKAFNEELDHAGRVKVQPNLTLPQHPEISVIGDMAALTIDGKPVPSVSHPTKQMGRRAAQNILAQIAGKSASDFKHIDYGSLATTGYQSAVWLPGPVKLLRVPA